MPNPLTAEQEAEILRLHGEGYSAYAIEKTTGIGEMVVIRIVDPGRYRRRRTNEFARRRKRTQERAAAIAARKELTPDVVLQPSMVEQVRDLKRRRYSPMAIAAMTKRPYAEIVRLLGHSA